jgi:hypothetical protein
MGNSLVQSDAFREHALQSSLSGLARAILGPLLTTNFLRWREDSLQPGIKVCQTRLAKSEQGGRGGGVQEIAS